MKSSYTPLLSIGWSGAMILRGREIDDMNLFGITEILNARTQKHPCTAVQIQSEGLGVEVATMGIDKSPLP